MRRRRGENEKLRAKTDFETFNEISQQSRHPTRSSSFNSYNNNNNNRTTTITTSRCDHHHPPFSKSTFDLFRSMGRFEAADMTRHNETCLAHQPPAAATHWQPTPQGRDAPASATWRPPRPSLARRSLSLSRWRRHDDRLNPAADETATARTLFRGETSCIDAAVAERSTAITLEKRGEKATTVHRKRHR